MKDGFLETVIADRGRGIAPEHRELVQEPFFTTKTSGLGLGLSICTTIMTSHGGDLRIVNNPDGGASVYLTLPIDASGAKS
jgi:signal transduction histidine kinase